MTVSRRGVVVGMTAAALAPIAIQAVPTALADGNALTLPDPNGAIRTLLGNIEMFHGPGFANDDHIRLVAELNLRLLRDHPDVYDLSRVMHAPTMMMNGKPVLAQHRKFATRWTLEVAMDGTEVRDAAGNLMTKDQVEEEIKVAIVNEIAAEIRQERDALAAQGKVICPHAPIFTTGVMVDPDTFDPVMTFHTRYGIRNA